MTKLQTIGFNATTSFNRSTFNVGAYVPNVGDKITVNITTEASVPAAKKIRKVKFKKHPVGCFYG